MIELYQVFLILGVLFYVVILTMLVIQKKINVRYSILWFTSASIMLLLAIFPEIVNRLAHLMGIAVPVNLLFVFHGLFLLLIALYLTSIVSWLTNRLHKLIQSQALLEKRLRDLEDMKINENCD